MSIYYLYVKTHLKTGLKYLGYTSAKDPHKYEGSGKYWKLHLNKHGNNIWTNIVYQSEDKVDIKNMGIYYSELWNIVESNDWANLKIESGDGGTFQHSKESVTKIRNSVLERTKCGNNPFQDKNAARERSFKRLKNGTHNFQNSDFYEKLADKKSENYEITFPNGDVKLIKNLCKFCRENNLNQSNLVQVSKGRFSQHKGFLCRKIVISL